MNEFKPDLSVSKSCPLCEHKYSQAERVLNEIHLLRCEKCSFVYADISDEEILYANCNFNEDFSEIYNQSRTIVDTLWFEDIARKLTRRIQKPGKVLDVGVGTGLLLTQFINQGWQAVGLDPSPWASEFSKQFGYDLIVDKLEDSNLPDNSFDIITSTSTLEHIPKPVQHLQKIAQILKPGGIAYFSGMPNYGSLSVRFGLSNFSNNIPPYHCNFFTPSTFLEMVRQTGIRDEIDIQISSYGIPELHRLYGYLNTKSRHIVEHFKLATSKKNMTQSVTQKPELSGLPLTNISSSIEGLKQMLLRSIVMGIYYAGKPLNQGDALEVLITKHSQKNYS